VIVGRFVPRWTFFAPVPGTTDFHVVWRAWEKDSPGPWREMIAMTPQRRPIDVLWNPSKFSRKATIDIALELLQESIILNDQGDSNAAILTVPYILLAQRTSREASLYPMIEHFQFAIVADSLAEPSARPAFVSRVHAA